MGRDWLGDFVVVEFGDYEFCGLVLCCGGGVEVGKCVVLDLFLVGDYCWVFCFDDGVVVGLVEVVGIRLGIL